jgi:hypothetical protein
MSGEFTTASTDSLWEVLPLPHAQYTIYSFPKARMGPPKFLRLLPLPEQLQGDGHADASPATVTSRALDARTATTQCENLMAYISFLG